MLWLVGGLVQSLTPVIVGARKMFGGIVSSCVPGPHACHLGTSNFAGHVTAGGSICIESLVNTGTPAGWQPSYSVESILTLVLANMVDCERTVVRTATGAANGQHVHDTLPSNRRSAWALHDIISSYLQCRCAAHRRMRCTWMPQGLEEFLALCEWT